MTAPTVADLKRRGAKGAIVLCVFCRHKGWLSWEQLRAPDDMPFPAIFERRKLRCTECQATKINVTVDWSPPERGGLL